MARPTFHKAYVGKLIDTIDESTGLTIQRVSVSGDVKALGGTSEIFATWDNTFLNPGGQPKNKNKDWNCLVIIGLFNEIDYASLPSNQVLDVQAVLTRQNPTYTYCGVPNADFPQAQTPKRVIVLQLQNTTNAVFTNPEKNQLKQQHPIIEDANSSVFDTFLDIIAQDAYGIDFTVIKEYTQIGAVDGPITVTMNQAISPVVLDRIDNQPHAVTVVDPAGTFDGQPSYTLPQRTRVLLTLVGNNWEIV